MASNRAEMQCTSYLPERYTTEENLTVPGNDKTGLINCNDEIRRSGGYLFYSLLPPCRVDEYQGCVKQVLRQTMLQQETTFKNQVNELHRLYKRQKELMNELKRTEFSRPNPEAETSQSNHLLFPKLSESAQKTCHIPSLPLANPSCYWSSVLNAEKFQAPSRSVAGKSIHACPNPSPNAVSLKDLELLSSNSKKFGKRTFDLELPADVYVDSDDKERIEAEKVFKVSEVPGYPPKDVSSAICRQNYSKLSISSGHLNSSQVGPFGSRPIKTNDLADWNKIAQLKKADTSGSNPIVIQALPCFNTPTSLSKNSTLSVGNSWILPGFRSESLALRISPISTSLNPPNCGNNNGYTSGNRNLLTLSDVRPEKEVNSAFMDSCCLQDLTSSLNKERAQDGHKKVEDSVGGLHWLRENLVCKEIKDKERESLTQMESGCPEAFLISGSDAKPKTDGTSADSCVANDQFPAVVTELYPTSSENKATENNEKMDGVDFKFLIDLNSSLDEHESAQVEVNKIPADINLEPPVSPENKESSPPRGKSEEKQPETSVQLSGQEDGCPNEDLAMIAAETIVSISSAAFQLEFDNGTPEPFETSCNSLQWLAGIVSSMADVAENDTETGLSGAADSNRNEFLCSEMNYNEAATLQHKEKEEEEFSFKSTDQKKKRKVGAFLFSSTPKRRRTKTKSQNDFQVEDAGTPETSLGRKNGGRNGRRKGNKRAMHPLLKKQVTDRQVGFLKGCLTGWGQKKKRQNGQRLPACSPRYF